MPGHAVDAERVEENHIIGLPGFLDEPPPVVHVGFHAAVLAETEEFLCHVHDIGIDVHRVDRGVRIMLADEHRQGPAGAPTSVEGGSRRRYATTQAPQASKHISKDDRQYSTARPFAPNAPLTGVRFPRYNTRLNSDNR